MMTKDVNSKEEMLLSFFQSSHGNKAMTEQEKQRLTYLEEELALEKDRSESRGIALFIVGFVILLSFLQYLVSLTQ